MPNAIGVMRERLAIQTNTPSVDAEGQPVASWATTVTVWGRAEFLSGRELEAMQKINSQIVTRFTVRYRADITELMRVSWRSKNWNINAVMPDEGKDFIALLVSKVE